MRNKTFITLGLAALLVMAGCSSTTVHVDYDRNVNPRNYKTFGWAEAPTGDDLSEANPLLHKRIVSYIQAKLEASGLTYDQKNPDLWVTYYVATREELSLSTTTLGYGYGPGWAWDPYWYGAWGYGPATTSVNVTTYTQGTLVIDIWDAKKKQLVWRGTLEGTVPENPEKVPRMIFDGIDKIVAKWQKMKKELGR